MPLTRFLEGTTFGPDDIAVMVAAYEGAMRELNFSGPEGSGESRPLPARLSRLRSRASAIRYVSNNGRSKLYQAHRRIPRAPRAPWLLAAPLAMILPARLL
jgi:hypothetical protein